MNEQFRRPDLTMTTTAAEGLARRRWTVAEIEAMTRAGILEEDERFELIGGEVVPMQAKGAAHEMLKVALAKYWYRRLPDGIELAPETTFRMSEDTFVEPDFIFWRTNDRLIDLRPATALLAVEVADSSLAYDLGRKAELYAQFAVARIFVIDAPKWITYVFEDPQEGRYRRKRRVVAKSMLRLDFAPELDVRLGDLEPV